MIKDHGGAGILMIGKKKTNLIIKNSSITNCNDGIVLNGPFSGVIDNNTVVGCRQTGIILKNGNYSQVMNNEIKECENGISLENSTASVIKNNLAFNDEFGLKSFSKNNYICKCSIKFNTFTDN